MRTLCRVLALHCLAAALAACESGPTYVGVGDVLNVDPAAHEVTIRHEQIIDLMDAGTTRFAVPSDEVRAFLTPGTRVRFELQRHGEQLLVTRANSLAAGNPGIHDHTPHHGGVVAMVGMIHLEAKASPNGRIELYLTDLWRRPLPLDDVSGTVTLDLPEGKRTLPLTRGDALLEAAGPELTRRTVNAAFDLKRAGDAVSENFLLPLGEGDSGAAGIPNGGCVPAVGSPGRGPAPRCTLTFAKPIAALAVAPDGVTLLAAQVDLGVSAWRLPAGEFELGFAPPPPIVIPVPEPPHPEVPNALLVRPDGREAVVALENRLIRYSMETGRVVTTFPGPGGILRDAAWSPDGAALLVSVFYSPAGYLLDATDGRVLQHFTVQREGAAVAFAPDGRTVAVGSESGPVDLFDVTGAAPPRVLEGGSGPVRALSFVGDRLVAAGNDGVLRVWDTSSAAQQLERHIDSTLRQMAVSPERALVATTGVDPSIQVRRLDDATPVATLTWHTTQVLSLAWARGTLISSDVTGNVAFWDIASTPAAASVTH
jgi:Cu/Ag efflux protein CusF